VGGWGDAGHRQPYDDYLLLSLFIHSVAVVAGGRGSLELGVHVTAMPSLKKIYFDVGIHAFPQVTS